MKGKLRRASCQYVFIIFLSQFAGNILVRYLHGKKKITALKPVENEEIFNYLFLDINKKQNWNHKTHFGAII